MAFADRLKEFREKEKLSQADFAKMIGISTRTLVHYEDGERYPRDVEVYKKIAEVMDCDYNYLLEESDEFLNRVYNMGGKRELEKARALTEGLSSYLLVEKFLTKIKMLLLKLLLVLIGRLKEKTRNTVVRKKIR